jgi:hypothetical protein
MANFYFVGIVMVVLGNGIVSLGTNFPPGNKSAATYLPKDRDTPAGGDLSTDMETREPISAVKQPEPRGLILLHPI